MLQYGENTRCFKKNDLSLWLCMCRVQLRAPCCWWSSVSGDMSSATGSVVRRSRQAASSEAHYYLLIHRCGKRCRHKPSPRWNRNQSLPLRTHTHTVYTHTSTHTRTLFGALEWMKALFVRAIIENRVNLQGITEQIEVGGSKQREHHKDNNVILRNLAVAFSARMIDNYSKELLKYSAL